MRFHEFLIRTYPWIIVWEKNRLPVPLQFRLIQARCHRGWSSLESWLRSTGCSHSGPKTKIKSILHQKWFWFRPVTRYIHWVSSCHRCKESKWLQLPLRDGSSIHLKNNRENLVPRHLSMTAKSANPTHSFAIRPSLSRWWWNRKHTDQGSSEMIYRFFCLSFFPAKNTPIFIHGPIEWI